MFYLLSLLLCLVVAGLFMTVRAAFCAPEGFEDETGFHLISGSAPERSVSVETGSLGAREALICR